MRYVDDLMIAWPEGWDFPEYFQKLNQLSPTIRFTTEWENNHSIPFLDTRIHRLSSAFSFGIYRKPTHSGQYIHYFSAQANHVKRGAVFSLLLRAYRLCDAPFLQTEIDYLYQAFLNVGFPSHVIDEVHSSVKKKFYTREAPPSEERLNMPTICLPNSEFVSKFVKPLFHANDCRVVTGSSCTLRNILVHNKPPRDTDDLSGVVYKINCKDCNLCYVGETGRDLNTRVREHKDSVRLGRTNNACFKHVQNTLHSIDWRGVKALYRSDNLSNRLVVESTLINSIPNFNNMRSTLTIENLAAKIILKANRGLVSPG